MRKKAVEQNTTVVGMVTGVLTGAGAAMVISLLFLYFGAFVISREWFAAENMKFYTYFAGTLASLIGGTIAAKRNKVKTLISGAAVGVLLFALQAIIGYIFYPGASIGENGTGYLVSNLIGGVLAGIICTRKRGKRR